MIFSSIQNESSSPFLGFCMFLEGSYILAFSVSRSYKKVII